MLIAQAIVDALGHIEIADAGVAATCTESGLTEGCHCERCEAVLVEQTVIPAPGHTEIILPDVPATYTTTGKTGGSGCSVCDAILTAQAVTAKLNPLKSYNVALNERFAINMKYVAFDGVAITVTVPNEGYPENPTVYTITTDGEGNLIVTDNKAELAAAGIVDNRPYSVTVTDTETTNPSDGLPLYQIYVADISAGDIGQVFTVNEAQGYAQEISVDGYCQQINDACNTYPTEDALAAHYQAYYKLDAATALVLAQSHLKAFPATKSINIYGQAAKNYFNQSGANHSELKDKIDQLGDGENTNYQVSTTVKELSNSGEVKFTGATVVFGDEVELLFRMQNYKNEQIYVNGEMIPADEIKSHLSTDGTYVYFSLTVTPDQFSTEFNIRAGSWLNHSYYGTSSNITYSVDTYIANMQAKYANDQSEKGLATMNLVNALGYYGQAATEYKNG